MTRPEDNEVGDRAATSTAEPGANGGGRQNGGRMRGAGVGMGGGGGGTPISLRNLRTFTSFKNPVFRLYYAAMLGQMAAMNMQMFARSFLVFTLTGSYTSLGTMALANAAPMMFFSLFGGVIADRVQKKYVLLVGQSASALVSLGIAVSLTTGFMSVENASSWWILVVASLAQGTIMGLMMPSRQAMIFDIVGVDELMNAVALNTFGMNILRIMAPALAGILVDSWGYAPVYYAMTGMYMIAAFLIWLMPHTGTISLGGKGALADIMDGLRYVKREPIIRLVLLISLVVVLLSMPYMMLLPGFAIDILDIGERGGGLLMMISGVGAMVGSLTLASLPDKKRGLILMGGSLLLAVSLVGFSFSSTVMISFGVIFFVGIGQTVRMTLSNTLLQYYVEDEYRGRVMSLLFMEFGMTSFAVFGAGVIAEVIGLQWSVGGLAIMLVVATIGVMVFSPRIRKLD